MHRTTLDQNTAAISDKQCVDQAIGYFYDAAIFQSVLFLSAFDATVSRHASGHATYGPHAEQERLFLRGGSPAVRKAAPCALLQEARVVGCGETEE